jgi:hypothetical protein
MTRISGTGILHSADQATIVEQSITGLIMVSARIGRAD